MMSTIAVVYRKLFESREDLHRDTLVGGSGVPTLRSGPQVSVYLHPSLGWCRYPLDSL